MLRAIHLAIDAPGGESVRGYDRIETPGIFFEKLVTKNATPPPPHEIWQ
jgi:hypothetical protein